MLANYSDMTISSVFSHHTQVRPEGGGFVRTQRTPPLDPPLRIDVGSCEIDLVVAAKSYHITGVLTDSLCVCYTAAV